MPASKWSVAIVSARAGWPSRVARSQLVPARLSAPVADGAAGAWGGRAHLTRTS